jgi:hypothetical protein
MLRRTSQDQIDMPVSVRGSDDARCRGAPYWSPGAAAGASAVGVPAMAMVTWGGVS